MEQLNKNYLKKKRNNLKNNKIYKDRWLHIGSGNFHRAHQAFYLNQLQKKNLTDWGIVNFEIQKTKKNSKFNENINKQDQLYTLITRDRNIKKRTIISSINKFLLNNNKNLNLIKKIIQNDILKLITLTVTENGYYIDNKKFNLKNKYIKHDIMNKNFKTIYGMLFFILENCILYKKKITIISCDNIENNSESFRKSFKIFCKKKKSKYKSYVDKHFIFCNSMVDRITPKYSLKTKKEILKEFKYNDKCHVESEKYISWIIQKKEKMQVPNLGKVGVKFVNNISDYQNMKMQILNASHCSTSFLASLDKKKFVYQTFNDPKFIKFINCYIKRDVIPNLKKNFINYNQFLNSVIDRFSNTKIQDLVQRTTINGSKNLEIFINGTLRKNFNKKKNLDRYALIYASWYVFMKINRSFDDENLKYLKKNINTIKSPILFIKKISRPSIKNIINSHFEKKYNSYVKMIQKNKIQQSVYDAIK